MPSRRFGHVVILGRLSLPLVSDTDTVPKQREGDLVYVKRDGDIPEGVYRRTGAGQWKRGVVGPRHNISIIQRDVPAGDIDILSEFELPNSNTVLAIWEAQALNLEGNESGLFLEAQNITDDATLYQLNVEETGSVVDQGNPLASGGEGGDVFRLRLRNSSGQTKSVTGFMNWSLVG